MTGEETLSAEARLIADLGVQVARLTNQVRFRDMIIKELKYEIEAERASVVAWLRDEYDTHLVQGAADCIERGQHRKEKA